MAKNSDFNIRLTETQQELFQLVFYLFMKDGKWPNNRDVQVLFHKYGDLWEMERDINRHLLRIDTMDNPKGVVGLTVLGISLCRGSDELLNHFVRVLKAGVEYYKRYRQNPIVSMQELCFSGDVIRSMHKPIGLLFQIERDIWASYSNLETPDTAEIKLSPRIMKFAEVQQISDYLDFVKKDYIHFFGKGESDKRPIIVFLTRLWALIRSVIKKSSGYNWLDKNFQHKKYKKPSIIFISSVIFLIEIIFFTLGPYAAYLAIMDEYSQKIESNSINDLIDKSNINKPIKFILCNFENDGNLIKSQFSISRMLAVIRDELQPMGIEDSVYLGYSNVNYIDKSDIEFELKDVPGNVIVSYGYSQLSVDTVYITLKYYLKPHTVEEQVREGLSLGYLRNNSESFNLLADNAGKITALNISLLYLQYIANKHNSLYIIKYAKDMLKRYKDIPIYKIRKIDLSYIYGIISSEYNFIGLQDSSLNYASLSFDADSTSLLAKMTRAAKLYNFNKDNLDSMQLANRLMDINNFILAGWDNEVKLAKAKIQATISQLFLNVNMKDSCLYYADSSIYFDSTLYSPYFLIGTTNFYECEKDYGSTFLQKALELDSSQFYTNYYFGVIQCIKGNFHKSRIYFNKAAKIDVTKFTLEYRDNVINSEYCKYPNLDSLREYNQNVHLYVP